METQLGYWDDLGVLHITADILGVCNTATQELSGDILWESYEYHDFGSGEKTIQIYGTAPDHAKVVYRLIVSRSGNDLMTGDDSSPCYTTCTNLLCCDTCRISVSGTCYCSITQTGCSSGACETRTFGWMRVSGGFSNYCRAMF